METRREIEQLFFKPCIVSIDDMDKFEGKEMMKMRPFKKNMWQGWLINHIPEPVKNVG